jgi:hypothetical protein
MKTDKKMTSKSHWSVRNNDKEIEYKGYLIEKFTWGRRQYDYFLSKDGVDIKYAQLIPYINLEPSIYNKKQCGLSIKNYKLLIDKYLTKEERIMQNNEGLFKPFSCESYEMSSGGYIKVKKETPSTCWKLYAKELLQTAYESPSHYQVNIRKDFKGIKPTTIKKMEAA